MGERDEVSLELGSLASVMKELARTDDVVALPPGTRIEGQYRIERRIGAGAMGVVFLARDEKLGRDVAVKVISRASPEALARAEREAITLAQLSHPNVVVVHQVGEVDGRTFLVMEHVAGGTARSWLGEGERRRSWRDALDLYLAAGEGLAAAHAAGIVHRDFKPDNVLIGEDGRPRVADFGLAHDDGAAGAAEALGAGSAGSSGVVGTLVYMPPEQLAGDAVDARADQFAFAASLWEALYRTRPFQGSDPATLQRAIERDPPRLPASGSLRVPGAVRDALRRALLAEPERRWPDLRALLRALRRGRDRRRRLVAAALGVSLLAAGGALLARPSADVCNDGPERIAAVWSPARAARLPSLLAPSERARLQQALDGYAQRWIEGHRDACVATRVVRSESEAMLDRRGVCLARVASRLDAALDRIETGGPEALAFAGDALEDLPDPSACSATGALAAEDPPPAGAERERLLAAIRAVAQAHESARSGVDPGARSKADDALALARETRWRPEIARALVARAQVLEDAATDWDDAEKALDEAIALALAGGSDATAARAMADLASIVAVQNRPAEATRLLQMASATAGRVPQDRDLARHLSYSKAWAASNAERVQEALTEAQAYAAEASGADPIARARALVFLAEIQQNVGELPASRTTAQKALSLLETELGEHHPRLGKSLTILAATSALLGELDEAERAAARAVALFEKVDARFRGLRQPLEVLGEVARQRGNPDEARRFWTRAVEVAEHQHEPQGIARNLTNLAILDLLAGKPEVAAPSLSRALAMMEAETGKQSLSLINVLVALGYAERELGHYPSSVAHLERASSIGAELLGEGHPETVNAQIELGNTLVKAKDHAAARALLASVLQRALAARAQLPPHVPVEAQLAVATAEWEAGSRRTALSAVTAAEALATDDRGRDAVSEWRAGHR